MLLEHIIREKKKEKEKGEEKRPAFRP